MMRKYLSFLLSFVLLFLLSACGSAEIASKIFDTDSVSSTFDGEIIAEFSSIGSAEKATGVNRKSIRSVLNGVQKEAGGFLWTSVESSEGD